MEGFSYNYYEDLTPEDVVSIVDTLKKGGKPKVRGCTRPWRGAAPWGRAQPTAGQQVVHHDLSLAGPSAPTFILTPAQVGSQHRSKAEPAGAVVDGKWVPSKPGAEGMTLMGETRASPGAQACCAFMCVAECGRRSMPLPAKEASQLIEGQDLVLLDHNLPSPLQGSCVALHILHPGLAISRRLLTSACACSCSLPLVPQASRRGRTAATWTSPPRSRQLHPSERVGGWVTPAGRTPTRGLGSSAGTVACSASAPSCPPTLPLYSTCAPQGTAPRNPTSLFLSALSSPHLATPCCLSSRSLFPHCSPPLLHPSPEGWRQRVTCRDQDPIRSDKMGVQCS